MEGTKSPRELDKRYGRMTMGGADRGEVLMQGGGGGKAAAVCVRQGDSQQASARTQQKDRAVQRHLGRKALQNQPGTACPAISVHSTRRKSLPC